MTICAVWGDYRFFRNIKSKIRSFIKYLLGIVPGTISVAGNIEEAKYTRSLPPKKHGNPLILLQRLTTKKQGCDPVTAGGEKESEGQRQCRRDRQGGEREGMLFSKAQGGPA